MRRERENREQIHRLLDEVSAEEEEFYQTIFLAPCVARGRVRTRVAGFICTFTPRTREFEGWGLFRAVGDRRAELVEEAPLPLIAQYLERLPALRLRLAYPLQGQTWLAYPVNEADVEQRWGTAKPVPVHLVTDGAAFEQVVARSDGSAWWFEQLDRRADPLAAEQLGEALRRATLPESLQFPGLTPEMRAVYDLAAQQAPELRPIFQRRQDEPRLQEAVTRSGGALQAFEEGTGAWLIRWTGRNGERYATEIPWGDADLPSRLAQAEEQRRERRREEARLLRAALEITGVGPYELHDRGEHWCVELPGQRWDWDPLYGDGWAAAHTLRTIPKVRDEALLDPGRARATREQRNEVERIIDAALQAGNCRLTALREREDHWRLTVTGGQGGHRRTVTIPKGDLSSSGEPVSRPEAEQSTSATEASGLREALQQAGGTLLALTDRGDFWAVEWRDREGSAHLSTIAKTETNVGRLAHQFSGTVRDRRAEGRLRSALQMGGAELHDFRDRGDYWLVAWTTRDGHRHTSAIDKRDLTVMSAGICLSGEDMQFDLQSLPGVMDAAD